MSNNLPDLDEYFRKTIRFWMEHGYDAFDYEAGICDIIPGHGAILGGMQGPIQAREDFENIHLMRFLLYFGILISPGWTRFVKYCPKE